MKRLVFLVEGDTELIFINQHVIPYLYGKGYSNSMNAQKIITNRKLHKKGGNINYQYLKNDVQRTLAQGNVLITTFLDFFRLPTNFPGYTSESYKIEAIESAVFEDLGSNPCILPYIQKHEMEALMFSGMDGFEIVIDDVAQLVTLQEILAVYANPEDINSRPEQAPSFRLRRIFDYDKVADGEMILEGLGIGRMISKCPRFAAWLQQLEALLERNN